MAAEKSGADILIEALSDLGVEVIFGYPGGAVLPIYDAIFQQNAIRHILVRHEQAADACRGGLCPLHRQGGLRAGDLRPRRDQCRHRAWWMR
jgi:glyoxylate carboligase